MKKLLLLLLVCLAFTISSCGNEGKAADAFENGTLKVGSTYEEVINAVGEPDHDYQSPRMRLLMYSTPLLNSFYYFKLTPGSDGVMRVAETTDDSTTGNLWEYNDKNN